MTAFSSEQQRDIQKYLTLVQQLTAEVAAAKERVNRGIPAELQQLEKETEQQVQQIRRAADAKKQELKQEATTLNGNLRTKERELRNVETDLKELQRSIEQIK